MFLQLVIMEIVNLAIKLVPHSYVILYLAMIIQIVPVNLAIQESVRCVTKMQLLINTYYVIVIIA